MPLTLHVGGARLALGCGLWIACAGAIPQAAAEEAGQVVFVQGLTTAQRPGAVPRFLAKGDAIAEGDVINTGSRGFAVLGLKDGAKYTLRPRTVFAIDRYRHDAGEENALMRLLKGGLRAVTGLIGKRNPTGVQLGTATATIGIRGTDFDARICDLDCETELAMLPPAPPVAIAAAPEAAPAAPAATPRAKKKPRRRAIARVARMRGAAVAVDAGGKTRKIVEGAPVFEGESVRTSPDSHAVVAFRDQTKVTVQAESDVKVESYRDEPSQPQSFVMRLVRGGVRAVTGLIGKRNPVAVRLQTAVATIGIRGTGLDALCVGLCAEGKGAAAPPSQPRQIDPECVKKAKSQRERSRCPELPAAAEPAPAAGDGLFLATWDGESYIQDGERQLAVPIGRTGFFNPERRLLVLLPETPDFLRENPAPRPDGIPIDFDLLFGAEGYREGAPGLYVWVREGHVSLLGEPVIELGDTEGGFIAEGTRHPIRLASIPRFLISDPTPIPDEFDESRVPLFEMTVDPFLKPGSAICEP
ncbi:MAG: hypothetical protein Fur0039_11460 [Rhodocyclaceae bacterium]